MQKGGRCSGLQVLALGAVLIMALPACVKRAPRSNEQNSPESKSSEKKERCGLICHIKKWNREREKKDNDDRNGSDNPSSGHDWLGRDRDEKKEEPAPSHPSGKGIHHTVKKGETLWRICRTYGADVNEVTRLNRISDPTRLEVGTKIWIPGADSVKKVPRRKPDSGDNNPDTPSPKHGDLLYPVPGGRISSGFGMRNGRMHEGVDLVAPKGSKVVAADDGKVVYSDNTIRGYGNMIIIKHAGNLSTVYAHNSKNLVHTGEIVKRGQKIAEVGMTGRATAPHVHFEVRVGEKPVDPKYYLP